METSLKDILSTLCSRVEQAPPNAASDIFILGDAREAKLANDVLFANGFDVRLYHENDTSKMYVFHPTSPAPEIEQKLARALSHARALKTIKQSIDTLCADQASGMTEFTFAFSNHSLSGKQINITLSPPASALAPSAPVAKQLVQTAPRPVATGKKSAGKAAKAENTLRSSGPELAKSHFFSGKTRKETEKLQRGGFWSRFFVQNIANNTMGIIISVTLGLGLVTLFIMAQGALCPDFANAKTNPAWYCVPKEKK